MADALCGPSNALSAFQKHSAADRSLHQDRLTGPRHIPDQGFRSFDPRTGSLDAQFHAFENGVAGPDSRFDNVFFENVPAASSFRAPPPQLQQQVIPQGWAADFSRLSVAEAPLVRGVDGDWQGGFMRGREQGLVSANALGKQAVGNFDTSRFEGDGYVIGYPIGRGPWSSFDREVAEQMRFDALQRMQAGGEVQEEDWSSAFEDAFRDVLADEQGLDVAQEVTQAEQQVVSEQAVEAETVPMEQENIRIGSDAIHYTEVKDRNAETDENDANALARVAGELLHNVQDDSSAKFQNSQFLELMRKIRDRQVEVRDNDFHTTGIESSTSGSAMNQPAQSSAVQSQAEYASQNNQDRFQFPDLNNVYQPDPADVMDFGIDSEQYFGPSGGRAETQIQDLHPGGRLYPAQMRGGVATSDSGEGSSRSA